jgi:ketosteroid isomerase-like protein
MESTRELIEKINKIFIENDMEAFLGFLSEDVVWEMHSSSSGHNTLNGKEQIANMDMGNMPEKMNFQYRNIVVEGNKATVDGTTSGTTPDGKPYHGNFCDIYNFKNGKITKLTSYVIDNNR